METHTSMSVSEKSGDLVGEQEKFVLFLKKIYGDESKRSNSIFDQFRGFVLG